MLSLYQIMKLHEIMIPQINYQLDEGKSTLVHVGLGKGIISGHDSILWMIMHSKHNAIDLICQKKNQIVKFG